MFKQSNRKSKIIIQWYNINLIWISYYSSSVFLYFVQKKKKNKQKTNKQKRNRIYWSNFCFSVFAHWEFFSFLFKMLITRIENFFWFYQPTDFSFYGALPLEQWIQLPYLFLSFLFDSYCKKKKREREKDSSKFDSGKKT